VIAGLNDTLVERDLDQCVSNTQHMLALPDGGCKDGPQAIGAKSCTECLGQPVCGPVEWRRKLRPPAASPPTAIDRRPAFRSQWRPTLSRAGSRSYRPKTGGAHKARREHAWRDVADASGVYAFVWFSRNAVMTGNPSRPRTARRTRTRRRRVLAKILIGARRPWCEQRLIFVQAGKASPSTRSE
jgi:hypothetical protein